MGWFQRYGIPGAYFIGLTTAWMHAFSGKDLKWLVEGDKSEFSILIALAAITFIPIGYIISIFQQLLYYTIPCLGIHRRARERSGLRLNIAGYPDNEATAEFYSVLLSVDKRKRIPLNMHEYFRDWIRKRMDVVAVNFSLFVATFLSVAIAFLITKLYCQSDLQCNNKVVLLFIVSISVIVVTWLSWWTLHRQLIRFITETYRILV